MDVRQPHNFHPMDDFHPLGLFVYVYNGTHVLDLTSLLSQALESI